MTPAELQAGIAHNDARALDKARWLLRWISLTVIPTGSFISVKFQIPPAAAFFRLEYLMVWWPVTEVFRDLFLELADDRGQKFTLIGKRPELHNGQNVTLFTSPGTDQNSALAGDQSAYLGMYPLHLDFPGRAILNINIRGALATPNPSQINFLLAGHQKNQV
jgi:hypothetical protein